MNTAEASEPGAPAQITAVAVLTAISLSHFLNDMMQSLLPAIYPILKESFHLDFAQIGFITLAFQFTASLLQPLIGLYTDRWPKPYSLTAGVGSTLALTVDGSTPVAQWLHLGGFEYLPRVSFPNKVKARIRCSSDFDGTVFLDGLSLAPATEVPQAGVRAAIFQGATAPQGLPIADRYLLDTTSDEGGAFQVFARDRLGIALPSSGSPTISDSLAE